MSRLAHLTALLLCLAGCVGKPDSPATGRDHHSPSPDPVKSSGRKAIVLSSFPSATQQAISDLQAAGFTVISPARVQDAFTQHQARRGSASQEQVDPLKIGRALGADIIVFLEVIAGRRPAVCSNPPCPK